MTIGTPSMYMGAIRFDISYMMIAINTLFNTMILTADRYLKNISLYSEDFFISRPLYI